MIALLVSAAFGAGGFYHPDDIAAGSKRFAEASERAGVVFEDRQRDAKVLATALRSYQLSLDLLGDRAPAAERERLDAAWKEYNREFAVLDAFAGTMMEDFDAEFRGALERSLKSHPGAMECVAEIATGPKMMGIKQRTQPNPDCKGNDLNVQIAHELDVDPILAKAVAEIVALRWPEVALESVAQAPIGAGERAVDVAAFMKQVAPQALSAIDAADREARDAFEARIEEGASKEELASMVEASHALSATTARKRAALGGPALAAAEKALAKWAKKGAPATAWCANPVDLGGCTVPDATSDLVPALLQDKKVGKLAE